MEENFKIIYKILRCLEKGMDADETGMPSASDLGISVQRWNRLVEMLVDEGYIKGVSVHTDIAGNTYVHTPSPAITLKGLEYLAENTLMKRAYNAAKGIRELIP